MKQALQGDTHWAGRERQISKNGRKNASVNDNSYRDIVSTIPTETAAELSKLFSDKLSMLLAAADESRRIKQQVITAEIKLPYGDSDLLKALATEIQKPELSEREVYLLKLAESGKVATLDEMKDVFGNVKTQVCPLCLQSVTEEYESSLVESIQKILSKEVENHRVLLKQMILPEIIFDFSPFTELDSAVLAFCKAVLASLNAEIKKSNELLKGKDNSVLRLRIIHIHCLRMVIIYVLRMFLWVKEM